MSKGYIRQSILSGSVSGIAKFLKSIKGSLPNVHIDECIPCSLCKIVQRPITESPHPATRPLQRLCSDIFPTPVSTIRDAKYLMLIVDEYTRYTIVIPIKQKSEAAPVLAKVILQWERRLSKPQEPAKVERIRSTPVN